MHLNIHVIAKKRISAIHVAGFGKKSPQAGEICRQSLNKQHPMKAEYIVQRKTEWLRKTNGFCKDFLSIPNGLRFWTLDLCSFLAVLLTAFLLFLLPNHAEFFALPIHPPWTCQGILVFWCFLFANILFGLLIERLDLWKTLIFERVVKLQLCKLQSTNTSIFMFLLSTLSKLDSGIPALSKPSASLHFFKWVGGRKFWAFSLISCC